MTTDPRPTPAAARSGGRTTLLLLFGFALVASIAVAWILTTIFDRKAESRDRFVRIAEVSEISTDPSPWGLNWPVHYEGYLATAGDRFLGGSSALTESKLERFPWLRRLYAGYAFSIDYREARGHAYMLYDQGVTERVTKKPQAGACLHCHGSVTVLYRKAGLEAMGRPADEATLAAAFDMPAVRRGFEELSRKPYAEVMAMLQAMPDGTPGHAAAPFPEPPTGGFTGELAGQPVPEGHRGPGDAHPVSCIDCHDPQTMGTRITRPGFMQGIADLAAGEAAVPHLPSIERWRQGDRSRPYDPNLDATRQEMRSFVCGQCHVEYYCATKDVLQFPWAHGLRMEDAERVWEEKVFPDGTPFLDYLHGETGAPTFKVQHPEFELWSQGVHARSGVSCADCHMPYERHGAMKLSSHDVQSPLENLGHACQTCHNRPEDDLRERVASIQARNMALLERAAAAMTDMLDAVREAQAAGADQAALQEVHRLQRKAMWRLDYISSENSRGFHADQEAARILGESIDYSRQAQAMALRLRAPAAPDTSGLETKPVQGVTGRDGR
jgi:nitrite reductase (cytochrome c-552)